MSRSSFKSFRWQALNDNGEIVAGKMRAVDTAEVEQFIVQQGLIILVVKPTFSSGIFKPAIKPLDIAVFSRQLSTLLDAGLSLTDSLIIVKESDCVPTLLDVITIIHRSVSAGNSLHKSLSEHDPLFDSAYINIIATAEMSGRLAETFALLADYQERKLALQKKVRKALFYPCFVIAVATIVTLLLLIFVVPQFEAIYSDFNASLPGMTQSVINLSHHIQNHLPHYFFFIALVCVIYYLLYKKFDVFRHLADKYKLLIPLLGKIQKYAMAGRFCQILSTTLNSGVDLVNSIHCASRTVSNDYCQKQLSQAKSQIEHGQSLSVAFCHSQLFNSTTLRLVKVGEESGKLCDMLEKASAIHSQQVEEITDSLAQKLEPLMMIMTGLITGFIVVSLYLPIFQLSSVIG